MAYKMFEEHFDTYFLGQLSNKKNAEYWRKKINSSISSYSCEKRRNNSREVVEDLAKISVFCKFLKAENPCRQRYSHKHVNKLQSLNNSVDDDNKLDSSTQDSTPNSDQSADFGLFTFRPGIKWSETRRNSVHVPREIFKNRK